MNVTFAPRGILQIDDARIIYRNFSGAPSKFNREGDRNFAVIIPDVPLHGNTLDSLLEFDKTLEVTTPDDDGICCVFTEDHDKLVTLSDALIYLGWNVKIKPPRDEDEAPFMYLPVKIKFNDRGPNAYLATGTRMNRLDEDSISLLDDVDILSVDLDLRGYDWEVNGKTGRTAYLQSIKVTQEVDRFAANLDEE